MSIPTDTHPARFQPMMHPAVEDLEEFTIEEEHEKLHEAGKLAAKVRDKAAKMIEPGTSVLGICMTADEMIYDAGAQPSFPINVSINNAAAHYTAAPNDKLTIPDKGVVSVDVGTHYNGFIADTAETVDIDGSFPELTKVTRKATDTAIKAIRPGTNTGDLGGVIEKIITDSGFAPIRELSGHQVERYVVHAGKKIPCVAGTGGDNVQEGEVFAIETFASNGQGSVHPDYNTVTIYRAAPIRVKTRSKAARKVMKAAIDDFGGMPFAERWLTDRVGLRKIEAKRGISELQDKNGLIEYHVLNGGDPKDMITQHEHTMIIKEDGAEVTTYLDN